jgi:hypothetical protein
MERTVFCDNLLFREFLLKCFLTKAPEVDRIVTMLHDAITAA